MLSVKRMRKSQIDMCFPLMQLSVPALRIAEWRRFAASLCLDADLHGPGAMVAHGANGALRVVYVFAVSPCDSSADMAALVICHLVLPVIGRRRIARIMADSMRRIALRNHCSRIVVELPVSGEMEAEAWRRLGIGVRLVSIGDASRLRVPGCRPECQHRARGDEMRRR